MESQFHIWKNYKSIADSVCFSLTCCWLCNKWRPITTCSSMRFSSTIYESLRNISSRRAGWGCRRPVRLLDRWLQAFTWRRCQHWRHRTNGPKSGCKRKDATPSALQVLQTSAEVVDMPWAWDTSIVIIRTCIQCTSKARHHQIDTVVVLIRQWNPSVFVQRVASSTNLQQWRWRLSMRRCVRSTFQTLFVM